MAVVLQEASLKMGPNLSLKCIVFQYVQWREFEKCLSSNVIHHCENCIEWHGCSASSVLSRLDTIPFLKLEALKGRRCGDISTIQEQSPVVCSPNSGEYSRHTYWGQSIKGMSLVQKLIWLLVCYINWNICLWCDLHAFRMQLDMVAVQGAFLDNVEHLKHYFSCQNTWSWTNPLLCGWSAPC